MNLNTNLFRPLLVTALCYMIISCKKLIEIPPNPADRIATAQAFSDSPNVLNVMSGLYGRFAIMDEAAAPNFFNGGVTIYTGLSGDELINHNSNYFLFQTPYYSNSLLPTDGYLAGMWTKAYEVNYILNQIIKNVENNEALSTSFRNQITGEALVVRAWCYFNLVNQFGGVPIVTSTDFRVTASLPRETTDKVFEFITSDLEKAQTLLTTEYPAEGHSRPNLYTAKALLAKTYLYRGNWQKAATLSGEVIDDGGYALEPDLNSVFFHGSTEAIWQYPGTGAFYSETNESYNFLPYPGGIPDFEITPSLYDAFETGDLRQTSWIATADVNGILYNHPYKYKKRDPTESPDQEDYMFLRLSEQYLIRAEARTKLNEPELALEDLNIVRQRAGLDDLSFSDQETLLDDILHERQVELFCEWGNRWFDQKRTGRANTTFGSKPNWQATDILYPIPLIELQKNPFLKQNPGY